MKVAFRVDASNTIGIGHVMRCLVLANELKQRDVGTLFICRDFGGNLVRYIKESGHEAILLKMPDELKGKEISNDPTHAKWLGVDWEVDCDETVNSLRPYGTWDWLVVDHYSLDSRWENRLRADVPNIMVIDDLADRGHDCDILLDQSYCGDNLGRYNDLVPSGCKSFVGVKYVMLRPEFIKARQIARNIRKYVNRIFINFGGADKPNATKIALEAVKKVVPSEVQIDVVVGMSNHHLDEIINICANAANIKLHKSCNNMAELMRKADLAIGCGGVTALERAYLGLPSLAISNAENQNQSVVDMAQKNMLVMYRDQRDLEDKIKSIMASGVSAIADIVENGTFLVADEMMLVNRNNKLIV
jgi:UDP-2,4-diacetamido-2,4,6-trideoxy-beta-L-altropyranose hydrolase